MPPFDKRARYPGGQTRVAIPTLSGGVGRQAPTKRALNEAENLDNVLVTLERSVEKRPPTNFIQRYSDYDFATLDTGVTDSSLNLNNAEGTDYGFFWFQVSEEQRYLIAIDYAGDPSDYLQIFRITKDGYYECSIDGTDATDNHDYFTTGNTESTFKDSLSAITVGPQMLINNNKVFAGYSSIQKTWTAADVSNGVELDGVAVVEGESAWVKLGLDGEPITTGTSPALDYQEDIKGRKLVYFTTTPVDSEGEATIYVNGKFYVKTDSVFAEIPAGTDLEDYLYRKQDVSGVLEFVEAVDNPGGDASNPDEDLFSIDTQSLPDSFEPFGVTRLDVFYTDTANSDYVKFTFDNQEGRDKAAQFTKFYIGGNPLLLTDAASSDNGPSPTEWYLAWEHSGGTTVADNRLSLVTEAVYNAYDAASSSSSTGSLPFSISYRFYGTYLENDTIPESLRDVVTDYDGGTFTLLDDTVLVFSCINDATSTTDIPATAIQAGSDAAHFTLRSDDDGGAKAQFIPVEDWRYPDSTRRHLGNKLADFSEFRFPPRENETTLDNDGTNSAQYPNIDGQADPWPDPWEIFNKPPVNMEGLVGETLEALYDDVATDGKGKIYYVENSYAGEVPGYYIVKDITNSPYTRLIRTPYEYSVLDEDRFPKILKIKEFDSNNKEIFSIINMDLEERRSGSLNTNPGPEAFKDGRQRPIKSMAFFRDRLFLSVDDTVFSSRTGDFSDFWVENPGIIADTDPIDIRLSTNKYAEVESMTPFSSNMFINTGSDIQFTLKGSENNITPFTAEISPTAFYSTSPLVDPILLGSQIYFFAPKRAYIFFNDSTVSINQAIEVSLNCPNYLPTNFGDIAVVPGYDSLCMIDNDNKKFVYMYTNRYRGAEVAQNAFFRYIFDVDIVSVNSYDNDVYYVTKDSSNNYFLEYQKFYEEDLSVPRIDHQISISESDNAQYGSISYSSVTDRTTIVVNKYGNINPDILYIDGNLQEEERGGEVIILTSGLEDDVVYSVATSNGTLTIKLQGDYTTSGSYRKFIIGTSYNMTIELSPQYVRDQNQNVIEGVFSIRTLHLQHHNTGSYNVEKEVRGRRSRVLTYTPAELDESQVSDPDDLPMPLYEKAGETFSKIMGFAAETNIFIDSDYPNPVNITQIELKGRFTNRTSGFVR